MKDKQLEITDRSIAVALFSGEFVHHTAEYCMCIGV